MKLNKYTKFTLTVIILTLTPQATYAQASNPSMTEQLHTMKKKVKQLEAALDLKEKKMDMQKMKGMDKMKKMKDMQKKSMGGMKGKPMMDKKKSMMKKGMSMKGMGMKMMGAPAMGMMGKMKGMNMSKSSLPGFPGASHIYHIGSTGFFLDHPEHITLTTDQQIKLNDLKEKSLADSATQERNIQQAEQELWKLTSTGEPDISKIEQKIQTIGKIKAAQRIGFIKAVGKAATLLTPQQRLTLTGMTIDNNTDQADQADQADKATTPATPNKEDHKNHENH